MIHNVKACGAIIFICALLLCGCSRGTAAKAPASTEAVELPTSTEAFEAFGRPENGVVRYVGKENQVQIPGTSLIISIPEEWAGRVELICSVTDKTKPEIFLANRGLMEAYAKYAGCSVEQSDGWKDWILFVEAVDKDQEAEYDQNPYRAYLGEDDNLAYYYATNDMKDPDCSTFLIIQHDFIQQEGQDTYQNLVSDLVCTEERVAEIVRLAA